jgi:hypothetical protein
VRVVSGAAILRPRGTGVATFETKNLRFPDVS